VRKKGVMAYLRVRVDGSGAGAVGGGCKCVQTDWACAGEARFG